MSIKKWVKDHALTIAGYTGAAAVVAGGPKCLSEHPSDPKVAAVWSDIREHMDAADPTARDAVDESIRVEVRKTIIMYLNTIRDDASADMREEYEIRKKALIAALTSIRYIDSGESVEKAYLGDGPHYAPASPDAEGNKRERRIREATSPEKDPLLEKAIDDMGGDGNALRKAARRELKDVFDSVAAVRDRANRNANRYP